MAGGRFYGCHGNIGLHGLSNMVLLSPKGTDFINLSMLEDAVKFFSRKESLMSWGYSSCPT